MLIGLRESAPTLLLVLGCSAAAALWLWRHSRAPGLVNDARVAPVRRADREAWREFETLVAEAFRRQGYQVLDSTRGTAESGGELTLRRERETFLVQCKHWKEAKVGVDAVHALQRAMTARGASGGFMLTDGRFAREAIAFANGCNVRLIDGAALQGLLDQAKGSARGAR
ncbi:MAG TPA: restriction endonuclease [Burkholderiaceae bacterium]|nr:restriction endonuclease [Burkholderiaceae bacterium]